MRYKDPNNVSKQKILLESFKLFATKPFSDITFTDIEKVTGLSRGAILYHFKSKDEILASIIDRFIINKEYDLPTIDVSKSMWDNIKNFIAVKQRQQEFFTSENKIAFSHYTDDLDGDWILDDYGIRSWVESLPTKSISMATLANSYRIIGL